MTLKKDLSIAINDWLESRKSASLGLLSKLTGISYPTLWRVMADELDVTPSFETVAQILTVVKPLGDSVELLSKHFPQRRNLVESLAVNGFQPSDEGSETLSKEDFAILSLVGRRGGIKRSRILGKFGEVGEASLEKLERLRLIEEREGHLDTVNVNRTDPNIDSVFTKMKYAIDLYDRKHGSEYGSFYSLITQSLNEEAVKKVHLALAECEKKIIEVYNDPQSDGEHTMVYSLYSTFLDHGGKK